MSRRFREAIAGIEARDGVPLLFVCIPIVLALFPWQSSLWLDETVTAWVIEKPDQIFLRTISFQGQSPLYYYLVWAYSSLFGIGEFSLRSLSGIFFLISCAALFESTRMLFNRRVAVLAVLIMSASDLVWVAALSARPYSLALVLSLLSILFLLKWIHRGGVLKGTAYAGSAVALYYAHYLFALSFVLHPVICLAMREKNISWSRVLAAWLVVALACIPGVFQLRSLALNASALTFLDPPTYGDLMKVLLPLPLLVVLFFSGTLAFIFGRLRFQQGGYSLSIPVVWWVAGPVVLFVLCSAAHVSMFVPRYLLWSVPGFALVAALILSFFNGPGRSGILPAMALVVVLYAGQNSWNKEDWRSAAVAASQAGGRGVFLYSGLVESELLPRLISSDPLLELKKEYLSSPFLYYKPSTSYRLLSSDLTTEEGRAYFKRMVEDVKGQPAVIVSLSQSSKSRGRSFPRDFKTEFEKLGYAVESEERFGQVVVVSLIPNR